VADAIAAGEVVERPASVVKELVENSLDAGARRVSVELRGAGRTLIRVVDDGSGIAPQDLRLAFQRHATSKVASLDDLERIQTLGFRGEALASVAAVSDLECRSGGSRVRLRAGEVLEEGAAMPVPGTMIEVRDLFANTPARLRFLKTEATEQAACLKVVHACALLYPEVRFEVLVDGRAVLRTSGEGDQRQSAAAVLGREVAAELMTVDAAGVRGLISQPRLSRGTRDAILLAVNRRPISSRSLAYAVEECYLGFLEKGRYPVAVLDLELDPGAVDVNVHPAKREVRFRDERSIFGEVQRAVRSALTQSQPYRLEPLRAAGLDEASSQLRTPVLHDAPASLSTVSSAPPALVDGPAGGLLRPLGQVLDGYLVAEGADGVVLVDQHAAHERVLYNRFLGRLAGGPAASQPMLLPETMELDPDLAAAAADNRDRLAALGFEVEAFGPRTVRVLAAPVETPAGRVPEAVRDLLAVMLDSRPQDLVEKAAASLACHSAVRFGDRLDAAEQRRLLRELEEAENSVTCPHGRPTRLVLDWQDLKRHFRRNY
jgi:DNA mismatch repair protein MutL